MVLDLVNSIRAYAAKSRGVLTVVTLHTPTQALTELAASLEHMVDAVIWLRHHAEALEAGMPVKELLVKKAKGAPIAAGWTRFIITDRGLVRVEVKRGGQG
jgi:KaiC/GvpD/RAD55 family RecA-like ATPase